MSLNYEELDFRSPPLVVVEYLEGVIEWHQKGLVPLGKILTKDPRCRLVQADFFSLSRDVTKNFDPNHPAKKHNAILLDIDHTIVFNNPITGGTSDGAVYVAQVSL